MIITNYKLFILEKMNKYNKDESDEIFVYDSMIRDFWRPIINEAQEFQNINFDLENNSTTGEKKMFIIEKNLRKDQPVKNKVAVELCSAGGDWEQAVYYFKIEFIYQHSVISNKYYNNPEYVFDKEDKLDNRKFVIIPDNDNGNYLAKVDNGYTAYTDDLMKRDGITEKLIIKDIVKRKKDMWKFIEDLIENLFIDRWEMLD